MGAWLALLVPLIPSVVLAVVPARTARWRGARMRLRLALVFGGAIAAAGAAFANPLGPAAVWLGMLFLVTCTVAVGFYAVRAISEERQAWRHRQDAGTPEMASMKSRPE